MLSPLAVERFTVKVSVDPSAAEVALALIAKLGAGSPSASGVVAVDVPSTAPSEGLEIVAVTSGVWVPQTWLSVVVTVKVLLVSPAAKASVPLWPLADQLTVSALATLSPLAVDR